MNVQNKQNSLTRKISKGVVNTRDNLNNNEISEEEIVKQYKKN